jgi:hypothetical protein
MRKIKEKDLVVHSIVHSVVYPGGGIIGTEHSSRRLHKAGVKS